MQDIIRQYGRTILILTLTATMLSFSFGGSRGFKLYQKLAANLTRDSPTALNTAQSLSDNLFLANKTSVYPKTGLKAGKSYRVQDLLESAPGETSYAVGGKALKVLRLYDGPSADGELTDVSEECIASTGKKVSFPSRGLYLLTLSVRDETYRNALQYLYVSIEGELTK